MKFSLARLLVLALATETAVASSWFTKTPYNKWHETELERWLSDHDIPFPTASDRKDLENLVKQNWQTAIQSPYLNWDTSRLQNYLKDQGTEVKKGAENNKDALVAQVKSGWQDADAEAHSKYADIKDWIFNSWSESSLKAYCDRHGIPVPQPRTRDSLMKAARENYQTTANKAGEVAAYPGNWLYESWSDSDLKAWLDERGIPAPQTGNRDKLVAAVRRNSYQARKSVGEYYKSATEAAKGYAGHAKSAADEAASSGSSYGQDAATAASGYARDAASSGSSYVQDAASTGSAYATDAASTGSAYAKDAASTGSAYAKDAASSASSYIKNSGAKYVSSATDAAKAAGESINAAIFDTWSDSQLKEWADKNGIKVPQGSKRNEVLAIVRKNVAKLTGDNVSASGVSAYGAATSSAGNEYAKASNYVAAQASGLVDQGYSLFNHYFTEAKIAVGLQTNYASSASASASSVYAKASSAVKGEL